MQWQGTTSGAGENANGLPGPPGGSEPPSFPAVHWSHHSPADAPGRPLHTTPVPAGLDQHLQTMLVPQESSSVVFRNNDKTLNLEKREVTRTVCRTVSVCLPESLLGPLLWRFPIFVHRKSWFAIFQVPQSMFWTMILRHTGQSIRWPRSPESQTQPVPNVPGEAGSPQVETARSFLHSFG